MRVALVHAERHAGCTLKDVAGGYGTVFKVGASPLARLLERAKSHVAALPNVTLAYLHALFEREGVEVSVQQIGSVDQLAPADLFLVASSITDCNLERDVMQAARRRFGARVGVFGTFAASTPEFYEDVADFVVREEIEPLVPALARGDTFTGVVDGGFVTDLDDLPFPRWDAFDVQRFRYRIITNRGVTLPVLGSRGCAYRCDYCPYLVNARFRTRSVDSLVAEIEWLAERYGARGISFRDPLRLFDEDQAREFGDALLSRGLDIRYSMECRADRLDPPLLDLLHRSGLRSLEIGVESVDPGVVAARGRRPPSLEQVERVVRHCHKIGIRVIANFLFGLPNDDAAGMEATARYARRLNTFAVQFTVATPYPGTALFHEVEDRIFERDWERFDGWTNVWRHPTMSSEEIHAARERAYVRYHFRPRYAWRFVRQTVLRKA